MYMFSALEDWQLTSEKSLNSQSIHLSQPKTNRERGKNPTRKKAQPIPLVRLDIYRWPSSCYARPNFFRPLMFQTSSPLTAVHWLIVVVP